jgi:UDP-glucose 4-epimerase
MKVLVWGGCGFLGSNVAQAFAGRGHEVIIADFRHPSNEIDNLAFFEADITDPEKAIELTSGAEIVINCAGIADIAEADADPLDSARANIIGNINLLNAASQCGVSCFVFASTLYVYSSAGGFYRCSKQAAESYIEEFNRQRGLNYLILRFGTVYGPGSSPNNSIYRLVQSALRYKKINYWGDPNSLREYIHINDASDACAQLVESGRVNQSVILSGMQAFRVADIIEMIEEMLGYKLEIKYEYSSDSGHYNKTPYSYSPKLAKKYIPENQVDLGQGLLSVIEEISTH